jgi:hypothetical protein
MHNHAFLKPRTADRISPTFTTAHHVSRHELTPEERARGRQTRALNLRERRERITEELEAGLDKATRRLLELIDSEDPAVALRAIVALYDRVLGRPRQAHEHSGALAVYSPINMDQARAKLDRLIENRARTLADENGHEEG